MPPTGPRPADADLPRAGDDVLYLLYRGGLPAQGFAAELHQWHDPSAIMRWVRSGTRSAGITGLGSLADAVGERAPTIHRVARIRIGALDQYPLAALDRYRIDYLRGADKRKPKTVVCDGQRRWRFYGDRVSVGPAVPVPEEIATLAAPSWLLAWRLSSAAEVLIGGRECFLFSAQNLPLTAGARPTAAIFSPVEVVLDARLGIPLRLTSYVADQPAVRFELRDVTTGGATGLGDFRFDVPPGVRVVEASGGILDEADAPQPVKFAAKAAGDIARHAGPKIAAVASFLDGLRGKSAPASGPDGE